MRSILAHREQAELLAGLYHVAVDKPISLSDLWKDYAAFDGGPDPQDSIQNWGNVEAYLEDRHGLVPHPYKKPMSYDDVHDYFSHPTTIAMAKLHSMAQGKNFVDGVNGKIPDDDLLQGAALGLLKIRRNQQKNAGLFDHFRDWSEPQLRKYHEQLTTSPFSIPADLTIADAIASELGRRQQYDWRHGRREARDRISDSIDVGQLTANALAHYDASSPQNREDGKSWYPAAKDYAKWAGNSVGYSPAKSAGVVASLSPQRFWSLTKEPQSYPESGRSDTYPGLENQGNNIGDAMRFFHHYTQHGKGDPNWLGRGAMGSNYDRVMRVHGAQPDQASVEAAMRNPRTGQVPNKITNFYRNLSGDNNAVTIDSWMARGLMGQQGQLTDKASAERVLGSPGSYEKMAEAVKRAAGARGILPAEMQATIWTKLNGDNYNDPDRSSINHPRELKYLPQPVIRGPGPRHQQQTVAAAQQLCDSVLKTGVGGWYSGSSGIQSGGQQPTQPTQPTQSSKPIDTTSEKSVWGRDSVQGDTGASTGGGGSGSASSKPSNSVWSAGSPTVPQVTDASSFSGSGTVPEEQAYAKSLFPQHGWGPNEMPALTTLWQHESDWSPTAYNPSGASGIAQFMPYTQPYYDQGGGTGDWKTQIQQGEQYIQDRYKTPSGAWDQYYDHPGGEGSY